MKYHKQRLQEEKAIGKWAGEHDITALCFNQVFQGQLKKKDQINSMKRRKFIFEILFSEG